MRDSARSYELLEESDLVRLDRLADAELDDFFGRNAHLSHWRERLRFIALAQGGADHYLRHERGIWDLDLILCFAQHPDDKPRHYLRRSPSRWDWGRSKFGRNPYDPPGYAGRAVDIMLWVIPARHDPYEGLQEWLEKRRASKPNPARQPDLAHEPVVLIRPDRGRIVWNPPDVPPPVSKTSGHPPTTHRAPN